MKLAYSIFLILVMSTSVAVSAIEQVCGRDVWQVECSADDTDEEKKNEKEEKEKEIYLWKDHTALEGCDFRKLPDVSLFPDNEGFLSKAYTFLPEIPPDAALAACSKA